MNTTTQTTTSAAQKTVGKRGRPTIVPALTNLQQASAVRCTVKFNAETGKYDYNVANGAIVGSAKNHDYLRNRIMGGELKNLAAVSNDYIRAFRIELTAADGNKTVSFAVKSK